MHLVAVRLQPHFVANAQAEVRQRFGFDDLLAELQVEQIDIAERLRPEPYGRCQTYWANLLFPINNSSHQRLVRVLQPVCKLLPE